MALADEAATQAAGAALASMVRVGDVITLSGTLGAGKTTLARALLAALGLAGEAPSPSFALVIAYEPPDIRLPVAHADLYRLDDPAEADELGLDDFRHDGALLIEWPEHGPPWPEALALRIEAEGAGRRLTWVAPPAWGDRWPPRA